MNKKQNNPKKVRRSKVKNAALKKPYTPRVRQEYLDYDYLDQLNDEELSWLNKFTDEWLNASFNHDETDIQSYEKYGKDSNDRNNARNRCLYGALKNKDNKFQNKKLLNYDNIVSDIENELSREMNPKHVEDAYIEFLDYQQIEDMLTEYDLAMEQFSEVEEYPEPYQQALQSHQEPSEFSLQQTSEDSQS